MKFLNKLWVGLATTSRSPPNKARAYRLRSFDAASQNRHKGFKGSTKPLSILLPKFQKILVAQAQDLTLNNPIAAKGELVFSTYATPIRPYVKNADKSKRHEKIQDLANQFFGTTACDVEGKSNLWSMQSEEIASIIRVGETLVECLWVDDWVKRGLPLPIQFRILDIDHLDSTKSDKTSFMGVGFDKYGRPEKYHIFDRPPAEGGSKSQPKGVENYAHAFKKLRPGQKRGLTRFAPVIVRLRDVDEYQDAAVVAAKMANMFVGSWEDVGVEYGASDSNPEQSKQDMLDLMQNLESGSILPPIPNKRLVWNQPPDTKNFRESDQEFIRAIATGLGVPAELLTNDVKDVNRNALRVKMGDFAKNVDLEQNLWISQIGSKKLNWFKEAVEVGHHLKTDDVEFGWVMPEKIQVEPDKESEAMMRNLATGRKSLFQYIRESGQEPKQVLAEIKESQDALQKLGFNPALAGQLLSIYPPHTSNSEK